MWVWASVLCPESLTGHLPTHQHHPRALGEALKPAEPQFPSLPFRVLGGSHYDGVCAEGETKPNAGSLLIAWPPHVAHRIRSWIRVFVRYLVCDTRVRRSPVHLACSQRPSPQTAPGVRQVPTCCCRVNTSRNMFLGPAFIGPMILSSWVMLSVSKSAGLGLCSVSGLLR